MAEEAQIEETDEVTSLISEEEKSEIVQKVMSANAGKLEDELTEEIEAEVKSFTEAKIKQNEEDLKLIDAVKAEEGNEGLTDDEAWEIVLKREQGSEEEEEEEEKPASKKDVDFGVETDFIVEAAESLEEEAVKALPEDVKAKLQEYEELKNDKLLNGFLEARKIGMDFRQFLSQMNVSVNLETMSPEEIIKAGLKFYRDSKQLSQDDYTAELEQLEDLTGTDKIFKANRFKEVLQQQYRSIEDSFLSNAQAAKETAQLVKEKAQTELSEFVNNAAGKRFYGLEVTPDMAKKVQDYISTGKFNQYRPDGTVNVDRVAKLAMFELFSKDIFKMLSQKGESKGRAKEFKARTRPSRSGFKTTTRKVSGDDGYKAAVERSRKGKNASLNTH